MFGAEGLRGREIRLWIVLAEKSVYFVQYMVTKCIGR